jgi:hypothetical protein
MFTFIFYFNEFINTLLQTLMYIIILQIIITNSHSLKKLKSLLETFMSPTFQTFFGYFTDNKKSASKKSINTSPMDIETLFEKIFPQRNDYVKDEIVKQDYFNNNLDIKEDVEDINFSKNKSCLNPMEDKSEHISFKENIPILENLQTSFPTDFKTLTHFANTLIAISGKNNSRRKRTNIKK